jgi:phytoene synthase
LADLRRGRSDDPICRALLSTVGSSDIPLNYFEAFVRSMLMDLTVTDYPTYGDQQQYMYGAASVIGLQMAHILEPTSPEAFPRARALGDAFQLTNFIRDVAEDLARGRVYLPTEDIDRFGVRRDDLAQGVVTQRIRALLRFETARTRDLYDYAWPGIAMLAPSSQDCTRTAFALYGEILEEVERTD